MVLKVKKKCYFTNVGVLFDKTDKKELKDTWNCNSLCCKSDLCNGLWCEDYAIEFNKESAIKNIKNYVQNGCDTTYGYIKEVDIDLDDELWKDIFNDLVKNYGYDNINDAKKDGYIPYDYYEVIEDYSSYWEEPDLSYIKNKNEIKENELHILKESELDKDIINWINEELYGVKKNVEIGGI